MLSMYTFGSVRAALANGSLRVEVERDASARIAHLFTTCLQCKHKYSPVEVTDTFVESVPKAHDRVNDAVLFNVIQNACDCHCGGNH